MNSEHASHAPTGHVPEPGYEPRDASASKLLWSGGGLLVALVAIHLTILGFYSLFKSERPRPIEEQTGPNIYQQLRELRHEEEAKLSSYGWVDRAAGVVRVPIDRAIELVAEKGVRFGKGPKTEIEMNSHAGTPVAVPPAAKDATNSPESAGAKP